VVRWIPASLVFFLLVEGTCAHLVAQRAPQDSQPGTTSDTGLQSSNQGKAAIAKDELWKKFLDEPSVLGVGVGSRQSAPVIYVYVARLAPKDVLTRIPKKYLGIPVSIVKTDPVKAR